MYRKQHINSEQQKNMYEKKKYIINVCITKYVIYLSYVLYTRDGTISVENKTLYCLYEWNDMKNKTLNKNYIHTYYYTIKTSFRVVL